MAKPRVPEESGQSRPAPAQDRHVPLELGLLCGHRKLLRAPSGIRNEPQVREGSDCEDARVEQERSGKAKVMGDDAARESAGDHAAVEGAVKDSERPRHAVGRDDL